MLNNTKYYSLTEAQKRIWYTQMIYQNSYMFNIGGTVSIFGKVDMNRLKRAICAFINAHDAFRIRLTMEENQPVQYFDETDVKEAEIKFVDFYNRDQQCYDSWISFMAKQPFEIANGQLFQFAIYRINEKQFGYFIKLHHIIADGWSMQILTNEINHNYIQLASNQDIEEKCPYQYKDFIFSEKDYLDSEQYLRNKKYWKEQFSVLPEDRFYFSNHIEGNRKTYFLSEEESERIRVFCNDYNISVNGFFVSIYLIYLHKATDREDIVIGTPVLGRSGRKERNVIGMFVSSLPIRYQFEKDETVFQTIRNIEGSIKNSYRNQRYPLNHLLRELQLESALLYTCCVNYYGTQMCDHFDEFAVENKEFYNGQQEYDLQLIIREWKEKQSFQIDVDYKIAEYMEEQIDDLIVRIRLIMDQVFHHPEDLIHNVCLISEQEKRELLIEFNNTACAYEKNQTVIDLFHKQVAETPDFIAIEYREEKLTYSELEEKANRMAAFLVGLGGKKEDLVGLLTYNSIASVIGILGILKAGMAYLPIDVHCPVERMKYMLQNADVKVLLTNIELTEEMSYQGKIYDINKLLADLNKVESKKYVSEICPNQLAYVIYTSGSTGKPKGVMIEHGGLFNYIQWAKKMYVKGDEIFAFYSTLAFDLTVTSIFVPLISGNRILVYTDRDDDYEYVLKRIVRENKATVVKLTPAHLSLIKDRDNRNSSIQRFIVGGEDLKRNLAQDIFESFGGNIEILNEYGPTETVVGCMIHKYDCMNDKRVSVPIGRPADNTSIYILDRNLNPLPKNRIGEIYIAGDGVARGYLKEPNLTDERFIDNPFVRGRKMYKTGDLAQFLQDDRMEYVGRIDQQVKVLGYRIELGEIESQLLRHGAIQDAVVLIRKDKKENNYLCAFVVKKSKISIQEIKEYLLNYLPDYMVPTIFVELEEFKLTINGKIDRKTLSEIDLNVGQEREYVESRNHQEKVLVKVLCEVLRVEQVSVKENYYHIGGDSIKAIQISSKLNEDGYKIRVKDILSNPVIEDMALFLTKGRKEEINQKDCNGVIQPTPIMAWFLSQKFENQNHYNQSVLLELARDIKTKELEEVFNKLIKHHDSLRMNYNSQTGQLFYNGAHFSRYYNILEYDLREGSEKERNHRMRIVSLQLKESLNIEAGILIKACVFILPQNVRRVLITAHHLVVDGVSWRILLEDMNTMLDQLLACKELNLPHKTHSYQDWAEKLQQSFNTSVVVQHINYWKNILGKVSYLLTNELSKHDNEPKYSSILVYQLSVDETRVIMTKANQLYNTEPKELLITALCQTIRGIWGMEDIVIELEGHGREDIFENINISRSVGWFTSIYPFYIKFKKEDLSSQIKRVKEEIRKIPDKGIGFGILKYLSEYFVQDTENKFIRFNYLGNFSEISKEKHFKIVDAKFTDDISIKNHSTSLFDVDCMVLDQALKIKIGYETKIFSKVIMEKFGKSFYKNLKEVIRHCCSRETVEYTPSDFNTLDLSQEELERILGSI